MCNYKYTRCVAELSHLPGSCTHSYSYCYSQAAKVCILVPSPKFIIICCLFHLLLLLLFSSMDTKVLSSGIQYTNLPASYVRPESERPRLWEVSTCENVPVIDLGCQERDQIVQQVGDACKNYGFFQVSLLSISFFPLLLFYILIVVEYFKNSHINPSIT